MATQISLKQLKLHEQTPDNSSTGVQFKIIKVNSLSRSANDNIKLKDLVKS